MTAPPWWHLASRPAPRMKPKPGGLFDTGATGVSKASLPQLTSVDSEDFSFADEAMDLFSTLKKGALATEGDGRVAMATRLFSTVSDSSDPLSLEGDFDFSGNADFCEVFTDLSQMLKEEGQEDMALAMDTDSLPSVMEQQPAGGEQPVKRTVSEALLENDVTPAVVHPDHSDYTSKTKRRKTQHTTSLSDSSASASSSMTNEDHDGLSKDHKYLERRRKNNIASKRSRETRKQKNSSLQQQAAILEEQNEVLRLKVEQLEKLAKEMKDTLVQKLAQGK